MSRPIDILFCDMDGTLLDTSYRISQENRQAFERLGLLGVVRVLATGRSLYAVDRRVPADFPIDYVICSSGAGVVEWGSRRLLRQFDLSPELTREIAGLLHRRRVSFMLHEALPDNHRFVWHEGEAAPADLRLRTDYYRDCAAPFGGDIDGLGASSQFLVLPRTMEEFEALARLMPPGTHVVRASSPFVAGNLWMEIFPAGAGKEQAAAWLVRHLGLDPRRTMAIGNDYNDLPMLHWAAHGFVVRNAPESLHTGLRVVPANDDHGVAAAIAMMVAAPAAPAGSEPRHHHQEVYS